VARARDIGNRANLSPETVRRMHAYFSRHRVDLDAEGAQPGEDGYPSAGAIAWMLWGGDPSNPDGAGAGWAARKIEELDAASEKRITRSVVLDLVDEIDRHGRSEDDAVLERLIAAVDKQMQPHADAERKLLEYIYSDDLADTDLNTDTLLKAFGLDTPQVITKELNTDEQP
jgi:hypothetical protein